MSTDRGDIDALLKALWADPAEPPPEGWQTAPIIDRYKWLSGADGALRVDGRVVGRSFDNREIWTAAVMAIDPAAHPRWVLTQSGAYRLGGPATNESPLLAVAAARDWSSAIGVARIYTGFHTLPAAMRHREVMASDPAHSWKDRRSAARGVANHLGLNDRDEAEAVWQLLAANPTDIDDAQAVRNLLMREPGATDEPSVIRVVEAWTWFADPYRVTPTALEDAFGAGGEFDAIKVAHDVGQALANADAEESASRQPVPAYVKVALSKSILAAWEIAREYVDGELAAQVDRSTFRSVAGDNRMRLMRSMIAAADPKSAAFFRLLGTNPADRRDVEQVLSALEKMTHTRDGQLAFARWHQLLTAATIGKPVDSPHDAFRSAFMAYADHAAGGLAAHIVRHLDLHDNRGFAAEADDEEAAKPEPASEPCEPAVVVLPSLGGVDSTPTGREVERAFKGILGVALPLALAPSLAPVRAKLIDEFPHLVEQIDVLLGGMMDGQPIRVRPTVLVGDPGGGKSRLARRLAQMLSVPLQRYDGGGSSDNAFGGTPRRWSSGEASQPLLAVRRFKLANPWLLIDEIEKAGRSRHNGSLVDALLGFLEIETSQAFPDPYAQVEVDLSWVGYVATANDETLIPDPLRDRFRPLLLPLPGIEHLPQLARAIVADIAATNPLGPEWTPMLDDGELAVAETMWRGGGSVRKLAAIVRAIVDGRERRPRN